MKTAKPIRMPLRRAPKRVRPSSTPLRARAATAEEVYDEEEDYEGESEPNMKLSHAFIVVLVLHIIAIGGIFGFSSLKVRQTAESKAAKTQAVPAMPGSVDATETTAVAANTTAPAAEKAPSLATLASTGKIHTVAAGDTLTKIAGLYGTTIEAIEKENGLASSTMLRVGYVLKIPTASAKSPAKPVAAKPETPAKPAIAPAPVSTKTAAVEKAPEKVPASPAPATDGDVYVVVKGDNPVAIAKKLHVSYNALISANDIKDPTKIQIGQKLKIPKKN